MKKEDVMTRYMTLIILVLGTVVMSSGCAVHTYRPGGGYYVEGDTRPSAYDTYYRGSHYNRDTRPSAYDMRRAPRHRRDTRPSAYDMRRAPRHSRDTRPSAYDMRRAPRHSRDARPSAYHKGSSKKQPAKRGGKSTRRRRR
jgi:hypothetical protein